MACEQELQDLNDADDAVSDALEECDRISEQLIGDRDNQQLQANLRVCRGRVEFLRQARADASATYNTCIAASREARLLQSTGYVTLLRVQEHAYAGWSAHQSNTIHSEVIFQLHTNRERSFGFELHEDANQPARRAMLDLLRDAFLNDRQITVDFDELVQPPNKNCMAFRVWLTKRRLEPAGWDELAPE